MKNATVIVVEKPQILRALASAFQEKYPGPLFAICTMYIGLYQFQYARGLRMHDFPVVSEPRWRLRSEWSGELNPVFELSNGTASRVPHSPEQVLQHASQIVYAADPDPAGAVSFHILLNQALGDQAAWAPRQAIHLMDLSAGSVASALATPGSTEDPWFVANRNAGIARRFFDYNFNMNSLALLAPQSATSSEFLMSKYSLQLLFGLRARMDQPTMSEGAVIRLMHRWPGTGKYAPTPLGSEASRCAILDGLCKAGLVKDQRITESGDAYLNSLHPNCEDADLPARMGTWESAWPASKEPMSRYLRMYFAKQAKFRANLRNSYTRTHI
ncbi:hypothetical protein [Comamonas thiooxydans]|uniref:hypothetical protein n=1 Tax=Comamonas thiooxydans TaxID=363952 RepID=UPI000B415A05|nr:hypothetical protein [Comamonas thiooxydans]